MRVSTGQIFNLGLESMQKHSVDVMNYQTQISSGNKYQHASDSGLAAGLGVQVQLNQSQFEMFKINQDHLSATYASSETQIQSINNMLLRAQQLMVQAGSDAIGAQGRSAVATELASLKLAIAQAYDAKDANGQPIFKSSIDQIQAAPHITLDSGILKTAVISFNDSSQPTITTTIDSLMGAVIDELNGKSAPPSGPTAKQTDDMAAALKQINQTLVKVGVLTNRLDGATQMAETQKTNVEAERSHLLDTDLAEASAGLMKSNALLSAAQSVMAKMDINTLFQKL